MRPSPHITSEEVEQALLERLSKSPLVTLRMDIINKCNLRCIMCHYSDPEISRRRAQSVTTEQFTAWFSPIGKHTREIMLSCGDEPLMSKHFPDIVDAASKLGPSASIGFCTNAMLMTSRIRAAIMKSRVSYILISIDGATPVTFERIRMGSSYEKVFTNIKSLKALKERGGTEKPGFILNFVMMRSNIHEAPALIEIGKDLGVDWIDFRHAVPSPPYWNDASEMLENHPEIFNFYRAKVIAKSAALNIPVVMPEPFPTSSDNSIPKVPDVDLSYYYAIQPEAEDDTTALITTTYSEPLEMTLPPPDLPNEFFGPAYCERPFTEVLIRNQREVLPCAWHKKVLGMLDGDNTLNTIYLGKSFADLRLKMMRGEIDEGCFGCPVKSGHLPTRIAKH